MSKSSSSLKGNLNPREKVRLRLEQEEKTIYDPILENTNIIFWGSKVSPNTTLFQRIRMFLWFYPDYLYNLIHDTRPVSFIIFYSVIAFFCWNATVYASNNPNSILNPPQEQILHECAVGYVNSLNPLYITHNQLERDLQTLIFNPLIRIGPDGIPVNDLAETWAISSDGKTYTFFLKKDIKWHDGKPFTADDVIFTLKTVQQLKDDDSFASAFEKIEMEKLDDFTVIFSLPEPSATFIESLSVSIVPKHILENTRTVDLRLSTFNQYPTGTGAFMVTEFSQEEIVLEQNPDYHKGAPKLKKIIYTLIPDEQTAELALKRSQCHTLTNPSVETIDQFKEYQVFDIRTFTIHLREKLIFINLRKEGPFKDITIRKALSYATDREEIIQAAGAGGEIAFGPISQKSWAFDDSIERYMFNQEKANELLESLGWQYPEEQVVEDMAVVENNTDVEDSGENNAAGNTDAETASNDTVPAPRYREKNGKQLALTLTVLDSDTNHILSSTLKSQWEKVGVNLIIDTQKYKKIASETIPRREFEFLLFEVETSPDPDKYNLWHSLKADYPGLNLSGYSYQRVDILLERARKEIDRDIRKEDYDLFQKYVMKDLPALFLYHPTYRFITHYSVKDIDFENVSLPHDRYNNVEKWYLDKD